MKEGWVVKPLADVCQLFTDGDWIESKDQSTNGIRLIQTGNVGEGFFKDRSDKARFVSVDTFTRLRCTEIFEGDVLISRLPDPVGRSCILPPVGERMITAVDCSIIRFDRSSVLPEFFNYYSQSSSYLKRVSEACSGATRTRISRANLGSISIPITCIEEQQRIVAKLDEAFDAIASVKAKAEQNLLNARALFDSYLDDVFSSRGEGWIETTLDKISTNLDSRRIPITKSARKAGIYPYYGASGIVDYVEQFIFDGDALLISEDGANLLARTSPVAFSVSGKFWVNNHAHILKFKDMATQKFIEFFFASIVLDPYITGAAQPKLNQGALNSIRIPLPRIEEQEVIVEKLENMLNETQHLESIYQQKLNALDQLKQSLLHQAFSGEL